MNNFESTKISREVRLKFALVSVFVFLVSYSLLAYFDFLPEPVENEVENTVSEIKEAMEIVSTEPVVATSTEEEVGQLPEKITFNSLNRSVAILNPTSKSIQDLDNALLSGVVRHPDSAILGQSGTVFILGHSSYLPKVINPNFQAFNGIQNLKWGDTIRLESESKVYVYRVDKVYKARATDTTVPIAGEEKRLVLATCNSFGSVDDRYIVEADLIEVRAL
ncbi:MAG: Sortase family protein [Parcubacteria bacterium OLB19]|nr:MAG: Sortase family protein [Parcubacteria bacterium OLB19]